MAAAASEGGVGPVTLRRDFITVLVRTCGLEDFRRRVQGAMAEMREAADR